VRVAIGSDHAGFSLKEQLTSFLKDEGHEVEDFGTHSEEPTDYPPICAAVGRAVRDGKADRGVVLGGSGQGEQIAANKVRGVRAALCNDLTLAIKSRAHNDANVIAMGARVVAPDLAMEILKTWLEASFDGGRHEQRIRQIEEIELEERET
jgi:ribose 5-phosphate isomerase B